MDNRKGNFWDFLRLVARMSGLSVPGVKPRPIEEKKDKKKEEPSYLPPSPPKPEDVLWWSQPNAYATYMQNLAKEREERYGQALREAGYITPEEMDKRQKVGWDKWDYPVFHQYPEAVGIYERARALLATLDPDPSGYFIRTSEGLVNIGDIIKYLESPEGRAWLKFMRPAGETTTENESKPSTDEEFERGLQEIFAASKYAGKDPDGSNIILHDALVRFMPITPVQPQESAEAFGDMSYRQNREALVRAVQEGKISNAEAFGPGSPWEKWANEQVDKTNIEAAQRQASEGLTGETLKYNESLASALRRAQAVNLDVSPYIKRWLEAPLTVAKAEASKWPTEEGYTGPDSIAIQNTVMHQLLQDVAQAEPQAILNTCERIAKQYPDLYTAFRGQREREAAMEEEEAFAADRPGMTSAGQDIAYGGFAKYLARNPEAQRELMAREQEAAYKWPTTWKSYTSYSEKAPTKSLMPWAEYIKSAGRSVYEEEQQRKRREAASRRISQSILVPKTRWLSY